MEVWRKTSKELSGPLHASAPAKAPLLFSPGPTQRHFNRSFGRLTAALGTAVKLKKPTRVPQMMGYEFPALKSTQSAKFIRHRTTFIPSSKNYKGSQNGKDTLRRQLQK
jgi:hypothetical protein